MQIRYSLRDTIPQSPLSNSKELSVCQDLQSWIKGSIRTSSLKWLQCHMEPEEEEVERTEEEEAERIIEEEIKVKEEMEKVRVKVKGVRVKVKGVKVRAIKDTRHPDILTYLQYSHAFAIGPLANRLIFAWSLQHVLGRISTYPNQINEIRTSSAI